MGSSGRRRRGTVDHVADGQALTGGADVSLLCVVLATPGPPSFFGASVRHKHSRADPAVARAEIRRKRRRMTRPEGTAPFHVDGRRDDAPGRMTAYKFDA